MEGYLGTILIWPLDYAPDGWAFCHGQIFTVAGNNVLFSLLGNRFGGDGRTTFALPDLKGQVIVGAGFASNPVLGQKGGSATASVTLNANHLPQHTHPATFTPSGGSTVKVQASSNMENNTTVPSATHNYLAASPASGSSSAAIWSNTMINPVDLAGVSGGGATSGTVAVNNNTTTNTPISIPTQPPYLALNFIICVTGEYPMRP